MVRRTDISPEKAKKIRPVKFSFREVMATAWQDREPFVALLAAC